MPLQPPEPLQVLDVGTGSGCIAITLALELDNSELEACDISGDALLVARNNAIALGAEVNFRLEDILSPCGRTSAYDIIVSNPPYICDNERSGMAQNVLSYEPATALFVPDDDPIRFYRAIAEYGWDALRSAGALYFETNPFYIYKVEAMLADLGYTNIELRNDQFGKKRFAKAIKP